MLKKACVLAGLLGASAVYAAAQQVGIVNMNDVLEKSSMAQQMNDQIRLDFSDRNQDITDKEMHFEAKVKDYQKDVDILSDEQKRRTERDITSAQRELQQLQTEFNEDLAQRKQKDMQYFMTELNDTLKTISTDGDYAVVLPSELSLYFTDSVDITTQVIEALDGASRS